MKEPIQKWAHQPPYGERALEKTSVGSLMIPGEMRRLDIWTAAAIAGRGGSGNSPSSAR